MNLRDGKRGRLLKRSTTALAIIRECEPMRPSTRLTQIRHVARSEREAVKLWEVSTRQDLLTLHGAGSFLMMAQWSAYECGIMPEDITRLLSASKSPVRTDGGSLAMPRGTRGQILLREFGVFFPQVAP